MTRVIYFHIKLTMNHLLNSKLLMTHPFRSLVLTLFIFFNLGAVISAQQQQDSVLSLSAFMYFGASWSGQSRIILSRPDGKQQQVPLKRIRSLAQIESLAENEAILTQQLNVLLKQGWKIQSANTAISTGENSADMLVYRYVLVK